MINKVKMKIEFSYCLWYESMYVITDKRKCVLNDFHVADYIKIPIEEYWSIMEQYSCKYITTHGYVNKIVFKTIDEITAALEWVNSMMVYLEMIN